MKLAGLDLGTTTISGVVMDAGEGRLLEARTVPNPGAALPGGPAWERAQDPAAILRTARGMLRGFAATHPGLAAVGVTGQMHGILYVDRRGEAVSPLYTWEDGRGNRPGRDGTTPAERLSARTGYALATGFGLVTHACQRARGLVPRRAAALCTIGDYVAMRLAGATRPAMDPSNAASLGCFDTRRLRFDRAALRRAGLADDLLPGVVPTACLGARRGHPPVCAAIGDNQASFLGSVADFDRSALVNIGTGSQVSVHVDRHRRVAGLDTRPFPGGGWLLVGAPLCGGRALSLLRDFLAATVRFLGGLPPADLWTRLAAVDPAEPGPGRPLRVDARFNGTRADPAVRGSIGGIGTDNFTPGHLVAAFETAVVRELADLYRRIPAGRRRTIARWVGSGNAVRLNPAIRAILRRESGLPLIVPRHREEAAFGAALAAGVAVGLYRDFRTAAAAGNRPAD